MSRLFGARRQIVQICQRLYERGLIAGPDGNVSVRIADDRVLVTPAAMSKVDVTAEDLVEVSLDGSRSRGARLPSSELAVHLRIYRRRSAIGAIIHAHPPVATGFSVAGEVPDARVLPELIAQMGEIALVPYARPGTEELADRFEPFLAQHDAFLMANHGAITLGESLSVAHQRMESLEHAAKIVLTARLLGRVQPLTPLEASALRRVAE